MTDAETIWQNAGVTPAQAIHNYDQGEARMLETWKGVALEQKLEMCEAMRSTIHGGKPVVVSGKVYALIMMAAAIGYNRLLVMEHQAAAAD